MKKYAAVFLAICALSAGCAQKPKTELNVPYQETHQDVQRDTHLFGEGL